MKTYEENWQDGMKNMLDAWILECQLGAEMWRTGCEMAQTEWAYMRDMQKEGFLWSLGDAEEKTSRLACKRFARDLAFVHDISTEFLASQARTWALIRDSSEGTPAHEMTEMMPEFFEKQGKTLSRALAQVGREHGRMAYAYPVHA